jgi:uncharacterized protein YbjT (DUF2867 family)
MVVCFFQRRTIHGEKKMPEGILLFGGTRGTGLGVAKILRGRGEQVTAVVRPASDASDLEALGAEIFRGDALDAEAVSEAFRSRQYRAVINSLGGQRGQRPRPDFEGSKNIVDAALNAGVPRALMVTAIGAGDSVGAVAPKVREVLGEVLELKTQAEDYLIESGLDYTILRPGGMTSDPASGTGIRTPDHAVMGVITRADLARLVVECLDDDTTIKQIYHTVDPEIKWQPPLQRGEDLPTRTA